jgi:putative transposase
MQLTQKIKINPTFEQEDVLWHLSEKCRLIYNFALKERKDAYKQGEFVSYIKQQNDLPEIKKTFPEYNWVYSKVLQMTLRKLDADYKSFFTLKKKDSDAKPPGFKGKKYFTTMVYNQSGFRFNDNKIRLSQKYTEIPLEFELPEKFNFCDKKVYEVSIFKKNDNYYISIVYEQPENKYEDNEQYQAFDLGAVKHQAVNSKGKFIHFELDRPDKYWSPKTKSIQGRRDHCKKYSRKWFHLNKSYNKCRRKSSNQFKDAQHKLSRKVIDNTKANTIIVGDLSVKQLCKINKYEKGLHASMHNTGNIGRFVGFLTYKAILVGKRVIEINERDTTKMCCCCEKKHDMPLWKRTMECDCGNVMDRDENSSVNIMVRYLSQNGLWTAYRQFVDNLRKTGVPIQELYSQEAISSTPEVLGYV